ncbi:ribosomal protein S12 methylthiotransferase accessory factor [Micromonospora citrea]|uniref:Ribosomal protein S12 methylthiotransferase accessory factor n=1 Tax=Micromonospora citrea TaxID=47855 RepID=A0A1C6TT30_9ACTN|nr:TOMM precursor leader peptide-binding protein [Micromonospora citrea]SCL44838.1 ribosomal protein S12 methylthiotransferase accessory factor [Micromonospora citrea]
MIEVRLLGTGLLADAIAEGVNRPVGVITTAGPIGTGAAVETVIVTATDAWDLDEHAAAMGARADRRLSWLPVRAELGRVLIGPLEWAGEPGCVDCLERRRRRNRLHSRAHDAVIADNSAALRTRPSAWLTGLAADVVAALVDDEITRLHGDPSTARTRCALLCLDLKTLEVTRHTFLPDPTCPVCADLPEDSAAAADIVLQPRVKSAPDRYRTRNLAEHQDELITTYVDPECGLIRLLARDDNAGAMVAAAWMGLPDGATEGGYGRTRSYRTSELVSILEALERHGGMQPGGRRTAVRGSYADLRERALDPRELGLYPPDRYRIEGFRYRPFDVDQPYRWVWGHSFRRKEPILVPEAYGYYRIHRSDQEPTPFVYEISNGCALGGNLEEAILHGILEVAERDAFLMTWYARMPVPRIDLSSARRRTVPLIAEAIQSETGYAVQAFDITVEQGVPCVWVMAVNPSDDDQRPKAVCAAGSHLDPETAAENALSELGVILVDLMHRYPEQRDQAERMVRDGSLVTEMAHHSLLYGAPAAFARFDFLTGSSRSVSFAEMAQPDGFRNADLSDDLRELVRRYLDEGMDVIVVDQTTPEQRVQGLACAKVIIPGTLPMTFGHDLRRVDGLPRLHEIPHRLGHRSRRLERSDVNPHPHPFP